MHLSREWANRIRFLLDELIPPLIRDQRWFVSLGARILYGPRLASFYLDLKTWATEVSDEELVKVYTTTREITFGRQTDSSDASLDEMQRRVVGAKVLEVGCGRAILAARLAATHQVTAADLIVDDDLPALHPTIQFVAAPLERLPFEDREFDTVICAHVLEHVRDLARSVSELRRVTARRLIVVVPKQRPYRYTFDPHLHFFPYPHSLLAAIPYDGAKRTCEVFDAELLYVEDRA